MKVELGKTYRDTLHGTTGIATSRTEYLTGCARIGLEFVKDGEIKVQSFDEPMVEWVGEIPAKTAQAAEEDPGGPGYTPPSRDTHR